MSATAPAMRAAMRCRCCRRLTGTVTSSGAGAISTRVPSKSSSSAHSAKTLRGAGRDASCPVGSFAGVGMAAPLSSVVCGRPLRGPVQLGHRRGGIATAAGARSPRPQAMQLRAASLVPVPGGANYSLPPPAPGGDVALACIGVKAFPPNIAVIGVASRRSGCPDGQLRLPVATALCLRRSGSRCRADAERTVCRGLDGFYLRTHAPRSTAHRIAGGRGVGPGRHAPLGAAAARG